MKKDHTQRPFLAYTNYPLRGKPQNLHKIFNSIERHYHIVAFSRTYIRRIIDDIIEFSEYNDPGIIKRDKAVPTEANGNSGEEDIEFDEKDIQEVMKILGMPREEAIKQLKGAKSVEPQSHLKDQIPLPKGIPVPEREVGDTKPNIDIAVEAVYGYRDGYCENKCKLIDLMIGKPSKDLLSSSDKPKCYECYQISYTHMLSMITEERPYSEMRNLMYFLNNSGRYFQKVFQAIAPDKLIEVSVFRAEDPLFFSKGGSPEIYKAVFNGFLYDLIAGDLAKFLVEVDNRRRLKRCATCEAFFIADDDIRNIYCSKDCKKIYKREYHRKDMQERRNPTSDKFRLKYI